jgi:dTDP-4-dehydrorhamnose 3,5-epimerase
MKLTPLAIEGAAIIEWNASKDDRGSFVKTFHKATFQNVVADPFEWRESYYSISHAQVIRGMHFQLPPHDHYKLVHCIQGRMLDVIIDLRKQSSSYLQCISIPLNGDDAKSVFIPKGCAHGFASLEDHTICHYLVSTEYHPDADTGIAYNSLPFNWPIPQPKISARDQSFISLQAFESPF